MTLRSSVTLISYCTVAALLFGLALALVFTTGTLTLGPKGEDAPVHTSTAGVTH